LKKNTGKKDSRDNAQAIVLVGNTYRRNVNPLPVIAVKLMLTYMLAVGTIMSFMDMYDIPFEFGSAIAQILLFVTAFMPIFIFIKKRYAIPVLAVGVGAVYYFFHSDINEACLLFKDYLFIQLDGRLLSTLQYVPVNSHAFLTRTQDFTSAMNMAMLIIICIVCFVCVLCCYKKFRALPLIIMWCVMFIPAFLSEDADYSVYTLLAVTAFFGLYAIASSNSFYSKIPAVGAKRNEVKNDEKAFRKNLSKKNPVQTAKSELSRYGRNSLCGILAALITFGAAFGSQKLFPDMTYIDTEEVINSTVKFFTDIGEYFSLVFSGNTSGLFSGYFSSDNFFINNNIELNAPPQSANDPVLKVTSSGENGMYLVGDIGVDFDGRSWIGVQRKISQNELYSGEYNISDSFSPEQIVQMTRYLNMSGLLSEKKLSDYEYRYIDAHYEMSDYDDMRAAISTMEGISDGEPVFLYSSQNVNIEYLKNTNVVFKPFLPDNNSYMSNENFKYFGDTVIRIADRKNWMKSFESNVTLPVNPALFAVTLDSSDDNEKISLLQTVGYTYEEARRYIDDKKEYDRYVYDTYSSVPKSEKDNIKRFIAEFESKDGDNAGIVDNKMLYAYGMCEYLRTHYQYSLNADNTSDRSNTMLGNFLFNTKQGHCALYASTMVLALREKGIPARYITGFTTGKLNFNEYAGVYEKTIHENSLHAWVEVYSDDFGWIPFDPTGYGGNSNFGNSTDPSQTEAPITSVPETTTTTTVQTTTTVSSDTEQTTAPVTSSPDSDISGGTDGVNESKIDLSVVLRIAIAVLAVTVAFAAVIIFINSVKRRNEKRMRYFRKSKNTSEAVKEMYGFIMKLFAATDIAPIGTELPEEFALRADKELLPLGMDISLVEIMKIIEKAEFSNSDITEEERAKVYKYTKTLYVLIMANSGKLKRMWLKVTI
jgi:transglutaminase-like putative cysteine protease